MALKTISEFKAGRPVGFEDGNSGLITCSFVRPNHPIASAMLHSSDNFEPLRHLAGISQHRIIECNADDKNPIAQISLATTVAETVCLQAPVVDDSVSLNLMPFVQTGEWAIRACWQIQIICDEEFFRMTRRKREGVVRYVERTATQSGGKITVTVRVYQQPLVR